MTTMFLVVSLLFLSVQLLIRVTSLWPFFVSIRSFAFLSFTDAHSSWKLYFGGQEVADEVQIQQVPELVCCGVINGFRRRV